MKYGRLTLLIGTHSAGYYIQLILYAATWKIVSALECYTCEFSYLPIDGKPDSWCADKNLIGDQYKDRVQQCPTWQKHCFTEVQTINMAFSAIRRGCTDTANEDRQCFSNGFGVDIIVCTDYCETDRCNNNFKVDFYKQLMESRFTSWDKVLKGEQQFNEEGNIHLDL